MSSGIQVQLGLRRSDEPLRPATAWLIQGPDPRAWLEEIAKWGLGEGTLRLYVMPVSRENLSPGGLFVITGGGGRPLQTPAAIPFGIATGSLYVPVHARVLPALKEGEWESLATYPLVVFHPTQGLVAFEAGDGVAVHDLLAEPEEREARWILPPVDAGPHPRIESIAIRPSPFSLEDLFGSESEDIGSDPPKELSENPEPPKRGLIGRGIDRLREAGLKAADRLLAPGKSGKDGASGGESEQAPLSGFKKWLEDRLKPLSKKMESARDQALRDLLEQLQKNPDEGLKHALPLASAFLHRGFAQPGTRLTRRKIGRA